MRKPSIKGQRGSWTANFEGRDLAVLHDTWWTRSDGYFDPMENAATGGARYQSLVNALTTFDEIIMQKDGEGFAREGYIGVFNFDNLSIGDDGSISLTLTSWIG